MVDLWMEKVTATNRLEKTKKVLIGSVSPTKDK